ncbi:PI-PLC domain-containing protein [Tenacibaculum xiamenense]|uniref:hypothetical protein n=1 Tax=Tenacibaculum xiamenense TaxID=1261553 RepID=UPI00389405E6
MKTIQFGLAENYDSGRNCDVATNALKAVEVHNSEASSKMWYHIGTVNGATVNWGNSKSYSNGYNPSIAINDGNTVVEVHETSNVFTNTMYYKVGNLNGSSIDWGSDHSYDSGKQPSVAINNNGTVVEVHKSQSYNDLYYRVGKIDGTKIKWGNSHKYDSGVTPSVSINNNGIVVEVHKSQTYASLYYRVGQIDGNSIKWGSSHKYQSGVKPSIGITDNGDVIEVHESEGLTGLWQLAGRINETEISWGSSSNFDSGSTPKTDTSFDGNTSIQVHEGSLYKLWYSNSRLMDTANFIGNLLPFISNLPLKKMVFPATHDTGMYAGGLAGRTQDLNLYEQLSSGARYFDLRLDGNLNIRHGIVYGPKLKSVLESIKQFYDEGHKELSILKFSHFDNFSESSYSKMRNDINKYLGPWLFKELPKGVNRLADITMGTYLNSGGKILIVVDGDWAINYPETGYWVYRDWDSKTPEKGDLTVYDEYSDTTDLNKMINGQLTDLKKFNGKCDNNSQVPCDLFLLSWTLTPITAVWEYSKSANRVLGDEMMQHLTPNSYGYFTNLLYLDYFQYARPAFIASILLKSYNNLKIVEQDTFVFADNN